ncbi:MAG: hypothetical protein GKR87_12000 [Kiritimatiellae bacterium]|nr:hypothetical protein [Kiritimatiellia bacterium]
MRKYKFTLKSILTPESVSYRFGRRFGAQKLKTFFLEMLAFGRIGTGKYHPDEFFERTG